MSTHTTISTTTDPCEGSKYSVSGVGYTHPPGTSIALDIKDLVTLTEKGGASRAVAQLFLGGVYLSMGESLGIDDPLRQKVIAHGRKLIENSIDGG